MTTISMAKRPFTSTDYPKRLFVQKSIWNSVYTKQIVSTMPELEPELVEDEEDIHAILDRKHSPVSLGKKYLYLAENPNRFFKTCPGLNPDLACCNLWVMNFATGCNLDCSYCFLQTYLPYSLVTYFVNFESIEAELDELLEKVPERFIRICTGELTDSLSYDHLIQFTPKLVEAIVQRKRLYLELKSKSNNIALLENLDHQGKVTVSWSMNTELINDQEEHRVASLQERLDAAKQAEAWGYKVGFHFDPIFHYPGWEDGYRETIDRIYSTVKKESIALISLGTIRYDAKLKSIVQERFPQSRFIYGEFIKGPDGKMRYPEPLRVEIFSKMKQWIKCHHEFIPLYLCMESYNVWSQSFGFTPGCHSNVENIIHEGLPK